MSFKSGDKTMVEHCICDKCKTIIHTEYRKGSEDSLTRLMERMYEYVKGYKDLNRGHECTRCRWNREDEYDAYVTSDKYPDGLSGCTCFDNPPCSYCTRNIDEDNEEN